MMSSQTSDIIGRRRPRSPHRGCGPHSRSSHPANTTGHPPMATAAERAEISRRNGSRSKGPTSPEGKRRSSLNALKHGMTAQTTVLPGESPEEFRDRFDGFIDALGPRTELEFH